MGSSTIAGITVIAILAVLAVIVTQNIITTQSTTGWDSNVALIFPYIGVTIAVAGMAALVRLVGRL